MQTVLTIDQRELLRSVSSYVSRVDDQLSTERANLEFVDNVKIEFNCEIDQG